MVDPFASLGIGGATDAKFAQDDAMFRVGNIRVEVVVGARSLDAHTLTITYADGLPQCGLTIPIGVPVGSQAADKTTVTAKEAVELFKKFTEVKVYTTIETMEVVGQDIGQAIESGRFLAFSGYVNTSAFSQTSNSSIGLEVTCLHRLTKLAAGSPVFSGFRPNGLADMFYTFAGWAPDITELLSATDTEDTLSVIRNAFSFYLNKTATSLSRASDLAQIAKFDDIIAKSKAAFDLFSDDTSVKSLLALTIVNPEVRVNVGKVISAFISQSGGEQNLLSSLTRICQTLSAMYVGTANQMYFLPSWPFWNSKDIKVLRGGAALSLEASVGKAGPEGPDSLCVGGTLTVAEYHMTFTAQKVTSEVTFGDSYLIETDYDPSFLVVDVVQFPKWMSPGGVFYIRDPEAKIGLPYNEQRLRSMGNPVGATTKTEGDTKEKIKEGEGDVTQAAGLQQLYARDNTFRKHFAGRTTTVVTGLRHDIVPGMNLRVDTATPNEDGADADPELALYGMVIRVSIGVDARTLSAVTSIDLGYCRNGHEQKIIESVAAGQLPHQHFCWADVAAEVNSLDLWEKQ